MTGADVLRTRPVAEITALSLGLGVLVGLVMSVANVYVGLLAGMTVSASIPAAVISMGILKGVLRRGPIHENNIVQTVASAGESLAAGIIFTMPALVITGIWSEFDYWTTTLVSMTGGLLGVLFMIPLRKPMIVESEDLIYPEGVACAKVLQSGEIGGVGIKLVFGSLGLGALFKLVSSVKLITSSIGGSFALGRVWMKMGVNTYPALLGVGWIVGFNIAALVFVGGALSWLVAAPILQLTSGYSVAGEAVLDFVEKDVKFLGVGAMIVGGLWSILQIRTGISRGIQETFGGYRASMSGVPRKETEDMSSRWLLFLVAATTLVVALLYMRVTGGLFGISILATVLMTICSFFFVAVAAYIVGLVGSSNSPVSGMTICSVLLTSAFVALFGFSGETAILATMGVAGVVCCATCTSGDVCQDLKTGHLVGATPYRQQWAEVLGVLTASFVMAPVLGLLHRGSGIGTDAHLPAELKGDFLDAPQARLFASLMDGFFGETELPWNIIVIGMFAGLIIILVDQHFLRPKDAKFRLHVMPVAVGMYLPFGLSTAILLGGLISLLSARKARKSAASPQEQSAGHERGVLLASGLIAGEAIAGVLIAIPKANEIALPDWSGHSNMFSALLGLLLILYLFLRTSRTSTS
ncbi:MAG: oligopeptide transporter, OPT family [Planctomycetota bacterium]|nr:oligopeptide transporter, OPT family [Planctomycetota bacterium]